VKKLVDLAGLIQTVETALLQIEERLAKQLRRRCDGFLHATFGNAGNGRRGDSELVQDVEAPAWCERKYARGDFVGIVAADFRAALDAEGLSATREEETQVIVDFRGRGHGRAGIARGVFLANRYRRSDS